jgi:type I restriction enzyme M protein
LENKVNRITDILRRDDGISGAMHYTEQISWILFLKFLNDLEETKNEDAQLDGEVYNYILDEKYRWNRWAVLKVNGKKDVINSMSGDDLLEFVNKELFPYLKSFKSITENPKSVKYKIGAIFEFLDNRIANGHTLREVLDIIDEMDFHNQSDLFQLSLIYEKLLKDMGSDGGNSGEFYTPRPLIKVIVDVVNPQIGNTIYDPAVGSCGFLIETYNHIRYKDIEKNIQNDISSEQLKFLNEDTFFGNEKTPLSYVMGVMNMILHGIESPNISKSNTLTRDIRGLEEKDRYDCILANPPFGGKEKEQIQQNFPIKSNATELLFLQHMMNSLKRNGKCGVVIPEGVLFQTNKAFQSVKKDLLERFNVHTILSLPSGVFLPYSGVKTNVIFFDRNGSTSDIYYYEVNPPYKLTKNKPIIFDHFKEFMDSWKKRKLTDSSWIVNVNDIKDFDISAKNPNKIEIIEHKSPLELVKTIKDNNKEIDDLMDDVEEILNGKDIR